MILKNTVESGVKKNNGLALVKEYKKILISTRVFPSFSCAENTRVFPSLP